MTEIIAYCGLTCQSCPIYLATKQENTEERARMKAEIVKLCKDHYGINYHLRLKTPSLQGGDIRRWFQNKLKNAALTTGSARGIRSLKTVHIALNIPVASLKRSSNRSNCEGTTGLSKG